MSGNIIRGDIVRRAEKYAKGLAYSPKVLGEVVSDGEDLDFNGERRIRVLWQDKSSWINVRIQNLRLVERINLSYIE